MSAFKNIANEHSVLRLKSSNGNYVEKKKRKK